VIKVRKERVNKNGRTEEYQGGGGEGNGLIRRKNKKLRFRKGLALVERGGRTPAKWDLGRGKWPILSFPERWLRRTRGESGGLTTVREKKVEGGPRSMKSKPEREGRKHG